MRSTYIFLILLLSIIFSGCNNDEEEENKVNSMLVGTWFEGPDSPYFTIKERFVYVFSENGECTEYVIDEVRGKADRDEFYYKLNTKNMVLTLTEKESGETWFKVIKLSDNNNTLIFYNGFGEDEGYNENNPPMDEEYYNDIDLIFHKGDYPF